MNQTIQAQFDQNSKANPLALAEVRVCESLADFRKLPEAPFVCFATDSSLETGLAREVFLRYVAPSPQSLVLMTSRAPAWSLASRSLCLSYPQVAPSTQPHFPTPPPVRVCSRFLGHTAALLRCRSPSGNGILRFTHRRNVRLKGAELEEFLQRREQQRSVRVVLLFATPQHKKRIIPPTFRRVL